MYSQRGIATRGDGKVHRWCAFLSLLAASGPAVATPFAALHNDPIAPVILGVTGILFSAIVLMVIVTTLIAPPLLKPALRSDAKPDVEPGSS